MDAVSVAQDLSAENSSKEESGSVGDNDVLRSALLESKLMELQKEKEDLEAQFIRQREAHEKQLDEYIMRYINADFWLAQLNTILPTKKMRSSKSGSTPYSSQNIGCDDSLICSKRMFEPATNLIYKKMHGSAKDAQIRVRQSNDDLLAWKFNPDSSNGKRMMGRIRQLLSENEKLGQFNHANRIASLESEAELQSTCIKEFIKTHTGIESVLKETYTDIEGLQNSLLIVHQQIDRAEAVVTNLQTQLESKQPGRAAELLAAVLVQFSEEQPDCEVPKTDETPVTEESDEKVRPSSAEKMADPDDPIENS